MILKLSSPEDKVAMLQLLDWDITVDYSPTPIIAAIIDSQVPKDEDVEVIVAKRMITPSYRGNPSLLAKVIVGKSNEFMSASGCEMPDPHYVKLAFFRDSKPIRKFSHKYSLKGEIREWLESDSPEENPLEIAVSKIPPAYITRPEHLTYTIKRETGKRIKLRRLKTKWIITCEEN